MANKVANLDGKCILCDAPSTSHDSCYCDTHNESMYDSVEEEAHIEAVKFIINENKEFELIGEEEIYASGSRNMLGQMLYDVFSWNPERFTFVDTAEDIIEDAMEQHYLLVESIERGFMSNLSLMFGR
jgi:hypothetical protein